MLLTKTYLRKILNNNVYILIIFICKQKDKSFILGLGLIFKL